jgi:nucleoid-associated protein YgaU
MCGGKVMKYSKLFLTIALALFATLGTSMAQEKMSMEEYQAQLQEWQEREAQATQALEECQAKVSELEGQIESTTADIQTVWSEVYAEMGVEEADIDAYRDELKALDAQVSGLLALSPEELFQRRDEVEQAEAKLAEMKKNPISALSEMQDLIATIEGKLTQIQNKMPKAVYDEYSVVMGDYLWKISGKPDIYDNPMQWMRIYSYNTDQIKDPDLIYPEQILKVHRQSGEDEYLVEKGDYLVKIAGKADVMGDPANWTKIYEKNKDLVGDDPNMIFPHTILVIPQE